MDFWANLFDTSDFQPRWNCGNWTPGHGWLHILSDLGVWSAYFAIPCVLLFFIVRRKDLPFRRVFFLFGAFILLCGTTHLMEAIIFWWPAYRLAGAIKLLTALVSWITVFALIKIAPKALLMRSPEDLEREVLARRAAESELQRANEQLEKRVVERTAELAAANSRLLSEREWFSTTLASIGDAVITTDTQGRVTMLNRVAEKLTGWTQQEAERQPLPRVFNILNEEVRQPVENLALRALQEGIIVGRENHTVLIAKDGAEWFIDDSVAPIRDEAGNTSGAVLVFRDISDKYRSEKERKRAEQSLRYQYDLTRAITDNATTAIFMMNTQGQCTFMNPAAEAMTGFTFEESKGRILHDLINHSRPDGSPYPRPESPLDRALPEKFEVQDHEDLFIRKNGEVFPVLCNARPIYEEGKPVGTVIEVRDLTQQKMAAAKLRESEDRFLQLGDAISQLAWMAHPDGHIDWYNNRWYEYTGTTFEQMEGWGWKNVHDPNVLPQVIERWKASLATGEPLDMVFPLRGADGDFRPFITRVMPYRNDEGKIVRWFGTNTDISEQKRIQDELRAVAARLSEADRRKDEFLATLAHELRNPLAPIRTGLEILKLVKDDWATVEQIRNTMERQTQQLITLVDDLLDVSRITRGKLELRKCQVTLADVMRSAVEAAMPFIDELGHKLSVALPASPIYLEADPHRLAQIFSNLLNNAAKYTPEGGRIGLQADRQGREVVVVVQDNGIGIPADMHSRIFEMFAQIDRPLEKRYTGLGIGLTLVKSLVNMHGGQIEVRSEGINQGSAFSVRLPILVDKSSDQPESELPAEAARVKPRRKVLVVDDNKAAAEMLSMVVKMLGNEVRIANDGEEAVQVAAEFFPHVVFMDIGMPKMNGYEAAVHIRRQPWGKRMMLVALTGWGQEEDRQRTREAGFNVHLVKPAEPSELQRIFDEVDPST